MLQWTSHAASNCRPEPPRRRREQKRNNPREVLIFWLPKVAAARYCESEAGWKIGPREATDMCARLAEVRNPYAYCLLNWWYVTAAS
jgi:hypothetical protein